MDFKVPVTKILKILPHPNADRLVIAVVYGYNIVVQKDKWQPGDKILFIPPASILPDNIEKLIFNPESKIKLHNHRVKQTRIRGFPSEGLIVDPNDLKSILDIQQLPFETDLAEVLNIKKYEPEIPGFAQTLSKNKQRNKKTDHPNFHKYNGLNNIRWFPDLFQEGEEVVIQEKLHGCLRNTSEIELVDGTKKTIQEIVDNKLDVDIWGLDHKTNTIVPTKVINWFNNGKTDDWLSIKYTKNKCGSGNWFRKLEVTKNHKFWLPKENKYKEAEFLKPGDTVLFIELSNKAGSYKPKLVEQTIISVDNINKKGKNLDKYDIETETHNFFVNGILVHNSNARAALLPYHANTLWKKIKKFFHLTPKYIHTWGSNNVQIGHDYIGYYGSDVYGNVLKKVGAFNKIKPNETIFGELIGGVDIQKNYDYGHKEHHFVLFDVKILKPDGSQVWLNPEQVEEYAKTRGFDFVPVLYRGPFNKDLAYTLTKGDSVYAPSQKIREGIVIKSRYEYNQEGNKKSVKWISEEYLDKDNTEFH